MIEEIVGLGFKRVELSHGIRLSLVPGILQAVDEGIVDISSVHNFCPLPGSVQFAAPNLYQPSVNDPREADLWFRYSMQTLDFATKVGADRVIMHSGSVHFFFWSIEKRLDKWIEDSGIATQELAGDAEFVKRREKAIKSISRAAKKTMPQIEANYKRLLPEAAERGLKLCLENREGLEEMPLDSEHEALLANLVMPENAVYWHDTGHAQIKHLLGLLDHREHLEKMSPRLGGFHLHDVSGDGRDHQVPGTGTVGFDMIAEFVRPEHTLVLELSPKLSTDQVLESRDHIVEKFS
jgi:sugar phosphate isomerase/epimerase